MRQQNVDRNIQPPKKEELQLSEKQKNHLRKILRWKEESQKKDFILGVPSQNWDLPRYCGYDFLNT